MLPERLRAERQALLTRSLALAAAVVLTKTAETFNLTVAAQAVAVLVRLRCHHARLPVAWQTKATAVEMESMQPMVLLRVAAVAVAPVLLVLLAHP